MSPPTDRAVVIDAGVGNLGNLERALHACGAAPERTEDPEVIARAHCLVLPGVGAFRPPRERLRGALEEALRQALDNGAWLLGICVGFQLLFDVGEEYGSTDGLGLVPGRITRLPDSVPLPHIGWNRLRGISSHPLFGGVREGGYAYFVHSFAPEDVEQGDVVASCQHGRHYPAAIARGRVLGTQFHPEKSGHSVGLPLLANYLRIARES